MSGCVIIERTATYGSVEDAGGVENERIVPGGRVEAAGRIGIECTPTDGRVALAGVPWERVNSKRRICEIRIADLWTLCIGELQRHKPRDGKRECIEKKTDSQRRAVH